MFPAKSLLALLALAVSFAGTAATPVPAPAHAVLPFTRRSNLITFADIVKADQARAQAMKASGGAHKRGEKSTLITNNVVSYTAEVSIGSPATKYNLIVDTGSSNTWVGATKPYVKTSTSENTGKKISVSYGSGSFSGTEYTDEVHFGLDPRLTIKHQSIGVASTSTGFTGVDGILGVGPTDLTENTVSGVNSVPTVVDNLHSQGIISKAVLGVFFAPTKTAKEMNGELTFGGPDSIKCTSKITYVPITSTSPSKNYWGIDAAIKYNAVPILSQTAGIVDTGTTLVLIASNAFDAYKKAIGATLDSATGLLRLTTRQFGKLKDFTVIVGGTEFTMTPNAQIFSRSVNTVFGGSADYIYLVISDIGNNSGSGLDFILGQKFLERFYSVYDSTGDRRVGLATTLMTDLPIN